MRNKRSWKLSKHKDLGLEHGGVHYRLASGYAQRGLWVKAKPHALAYGQTWAAAWSDVARANFVKPWPSGQESEQWSREVSEN